MNGVEEKAVNRIHYFLKLAVQIHNVVWSENKEEDKSWPCLTWSSLYENLDKELTFCVCELRAGYWHDHHFVNSMSLLHILCCVYFFFTLKVANKKTRA